MGARGGVTGKKPFIQTRESRPGQEHLAESSPRFCPWSTPVFAEMMKLFALGFRDNKMAYTVYEERILNSQKIKGGSTFSYRNCTPLPPPRAILPPCLIVPSVAHILAFFSTNCHIFNENSCNIHIGTF